MSEFLDGDHDIQKHGDKLPHWQQGSVMQFVTFRLCDAMPASKTEKWREDRKIWMSLHPDPWDETTRKKYHQRFTNKIEYWLDQGYGSCLFKEKENRTVLENVIMRDHGSRADFHAWVIMPNHVHLLFTPQFELPKLIGSWKSISARRIGMGSIWQRDYRDILIRNSQHFSNAVKYIRINPKNLRPNRFTLWESERAKECERHRPHE